MKSKKECLHALETIMDTKLEEVDGLWWPIETVGQLRREECKTLRNLIYEHCEKEKPVKPLSESMADKLCPKCGAHLSFDALNDRVADADEKGDTSIYRRIHLFVLNLKERDSFLCGRVSK